VTVSTASTDPSLAAPVRPLPSELRLRGGRLFLARAAWLALAVLTAVLLLGSLPLNFTARSQVCEAASCDTNQLSPADAAALAAVGLTPRDYAAFSIALDLLVAVAFGASALLIVTRQSDHALALFVSLMLITFGWVTLTGAGQGLATVAPAWWWPTQLIAYLGDLAIVAFFLVFPTGRVVPRWGGALLLLWALLQAPAYFLPATSLNLRVANEGLYALLFVGGLLAALAAQVYRYRRVSGHTERQQTKWAVLGASAALVGFLAAGILLPATPSVLAVLLLMAVQRLCMLLVPVSLAMALLRYRLWAVDPLVNRALVYAVLTACVAALYVVVVGGLSALFQAQGNWLIALLATGLAAAAFEPLRARFQRAINYLMYGERDDPAAVLRRLGQQLQGVVAPEAVMSTIVQTMGGALKLPYAALTLNIGGEERVFAEYGQAPAGVVRLPLTYQSETIGHLVVAPRGAGEQFTSADERALSLLAQEVGVAAQTLILADDLRRLNADLQRSRERLVTAREEERRRLRRDLHDGLGPTLASLSQRLDRARRLVGRDPAAAEKLLEELKGQVRGTLAELRQLVYALRPPVLDELGLLSALREHTRQHGAAAGVALTLDAPERLPPLPAAVEVAAYRIALEAFTNVMRHANAAHCTVRLALADDALSVEVVDDGRGLPEGHRAGVGLAAMRERAAELGGTCTLESGPNGTRVRARLPLAAAEIGAEHG
jgi:signal transduction histidine kinase